MHNTENITDCINIAYNTGSPVESEKGKRQLAALINRVTGQDTDLEVGGIYHTSHLDTHQADEGQGIAGMYIVIGFTTLEYKLHVIIKDYDGLNDKIYFVEVEYFKHSVCEQEAFGRFQSVGANCLPTKSYKKGYTKEDAAIFSQSYMKTV